MSGEGVSEEIEVRVSSGWKVVSERKVRVEVTVVERWWWK